MNVLISILGVKKRLVIDCINPHQGNNVKDFIYFEIMILLNGNILTYLNLKIYFFQKC